MTKLESRWIDVRGIRTRYSEAGSGDPIVFVYGANFGMAEASASLETWAPNMAALAGRFRVVAFDKLGQGFTDNPAQDADYTMAAVVRHAGDFIEALKLPPVHLVGHSRGGFAATRLALERQHLVRSLTIVNSGTLSPRVGTNEVALSQPPFPLGTREAVRWVYEHYCIRREWIDEAWVDLLVETLTLPKYAASIDKMEREGLRTRLFVPGLARDKREALAWLAEGRLQRPTQIVWGADDPTATVEGGFELFQRIAAHERRTVLGVINQSGHFPFREHPERFNALMARFADWASA